MSNANDRERSDEGSGDWLEPLPSGDKQGASNEAASDGLCPQCNGYGWAVLPFPAPYPDRCPTCQGTGRAVDSRSSISTLEPRGPETVGSTRAAGAAEGAEATMCQNCLAGVELIAMFDGKLHPIVCSKCNGHWWSEERGSNK